MQILPSLVSGRYKLMPALKEGESVTCTTCFDSARWSQLSREQV